MTRAWLPHPARTIPAPPPCPAGTRYPTQLIAVTALHGRVGDSGFDAVPCWLGCGGFHHQPRERSTDR
jgi:hypothetical protein